MYSEFFMKYSSLQPLSIARMLGLMMFLASANTILPITGFLKNLILPEKKHKKTIECNIFVHGVCSIERHLNIPAIINFFKDEVYNTYYHHNLTLYRQDSYFYQFQAMQDLGLHEINDHSISCGNVCGAVTAVINKTFSLISSEKQANQRYYTYGWSGLHSEKAYYIEGKQFYHDMVALKRKLSARGDTVIIKIWGYSHGGNVALMMAHQLQPETTHLIDELILLGTPFISHSTVELIATPLFKKVYNIYSFADKVQRYDLIHPKAFLCEQKLTSKSLNPLPDNLIQVRLKYTLPSQQAQKNPKSFLHSHDFNKKSIITGESRLLKTMSPGHLELWLFGWTFSHYRPDFITYPLPAGAFSIPYALHYLDEIIKPSSHNPKEEFIIDVRPYHEVVLINQKTKKHGTINHCIAPFFPFDEFASLKEQALCYKPTNLTYETYCEKLEIIDQQTIELINQQSVQIV